MVNNNRHYIKEDVRFNYTMPINTTTRITIYQSTYDQFPNVFRAFPNLENVDFGTSDIRFIDDSLIPTGVTIKRFACGFCKLKSVPGAINLFRLLEKCDLRGNGITTVERNSFDNLQSLQTILLSDNPIIYISRFAFRNLGNLRSLDF